MGKVMSHLACIARAVRLSECIWSLSIYKIEQELWNCKPKHALLSRQSVSKKLQLLKNSWRRSGRQETEVATGAVALPPRKRRKSLLLMKTKLKIWQT